MGGNKVRCSAKRWSLLRSLYEQYGLALDQVAAVSGIGVTQVIERSCSELWQELAKTKFVDEDRSQGRSPTIAKPVTQKTVRDLRISNARTAKQVTAFLKRMLTAQTKKPKPGDAVTDAQTKTKNVLAIAKGVLIIEEMIASLEKVSDAVDRYPQDALEFHRTLEKQITNLTNK